MNLFSTRQEAFGSNEKINSKHSKMMKNKYLSGRVINFIKKCNTILLKKFLIRP